MNDHELKQRLDQLRMPPPEEGAKERAWHRAELAFKNRAQESEAAETRWPGLRVFALAVTACVAIAAAFIIGRWSNDQAPSDEMRLVAELQRLFPNQLQAVIRSGGQTEIVTSPDETTFSSQPLLVELREGKRRVRIVSFSGQRITTPLDGHIATLEFLVTPEGTVIVTGDSFVWRSDRPAAVGGWQIEARQLTASR